MLISYEYPNRRYRTTSLCIAKGASLRYGLVSLCGRGRRERGMDADWFRRQHRLTGVSQAQLAARMGRAPTFLTRVYSGRQKLQLDQAQDIARIMGLPLSDVLRHAGLQLAAEVLTAEPAPPPAPADAEVARMPGSERLVAQGPDQSLWRMGSRTMAMAGILPGDELLIDAAERPLSGDTVLARVTDWRSGQATRLVRIWRPPYLVRPALEAEPPLAVDSERVAIEGVVMAVLRIRRR